MDSLTRPRPPGLEGQSPASPPARPSSALIARTLQSLSARWHLCPMNVTYEAVRALEVLLSELFTPHELLRWLRSLPDGDRMAANLPSGSVSSAQLVYEAVDLFHRYGLLTSQQFWNSLQAIAPTFIKPRVEALAKHVGITVSISTNLPLGPQPDLDLLSITTSPSHITVLLLSASPDDRERLRVDVEFRRIVDKIRGTRFREMFRFIQVQAARYEDLQTALLEHQPHILHISGHGHPDGSLQFEADVQGDGRVSKKRLLRLLKTLRDNLRLAIVNACHSHELARDIPPNIDAAIGMNATVTDVASIAFAASFYESIGYGRSVERSFDLAVANLDDLDGEDDIPQLFPAAEQDPENMRQIKFV